MAAELWVSRLGTVRYRDALDLQLELRDARRSGAIPDTLLLLEHPPVFTKGRRTGADELPMGEQWYEMQGIEIAEADRGGRVTYHGPGQLVAYPIVDLGDLEAGRDVHAYVRAVERAMIAALGDHGVTAQVFDGLTGVWTAGAPPIEPGSPGPQGSPVGSPVEPGPEGSEARKIGSIGVHVSAGVTTHGLAVNVNNDLQPFEWVVPCGIDYVRMSSLCRELGGQQDIEAFGSAIADRLAEALAREAVAIEPPALLEHAATAVS